MPIERAYNIILFDGMIVQVLCFSIWILCNYLFIVFSNHMNIYITNLVAENVFWENNK